MSKAEYLLEKMRENKKLVSEKVVVDTKTLLQKVTTARDLLVEKLNETKDQKIHWVVEPLDAKDVESGARVVVWVDVARLNVGFEKDVDAYIGPNGVDGIGRNSKTPGRDRYAGFGTFVTQGQPIRMSSVSLDPVHKAVRFENGRHRFSWLRDHGAKALPVVTTAENAEELKKMFGTTIRKTFCKIDA